MWLIFSLVKRWDVVCAKWWSGRPLSGDICGGKGGEIDRRRWVWDGTRTSGEGIGVVDVDEVVLGRSNERLGFLIGICLWLIGVDKLDDSALGTLSSELVGNVVIFRADCCWWSVIDGSKSNPDIRWNQKNVFYHDFRRITSRF